MAQSEYSYVTASGVPGGILDLAPYECNSRVTDADNVKFGMGVVTGASAGASVKVPSATSDVFEGVAVWKAHEADKDGTVTIAQGEALSIMRFGRIWARVDDSVTIAANDKVYLIATGDNAGCFTNVATSNIAVSGRFVGANENGIAPVVLYNN